MPTSSRPRSKKPAPLSKSSSWAFRPTCSGGALGGRASGPPRLRSRPLRSRPCFPRGSPRFRLIARSPLAGDACCFGFASLRVPLSREAPSLAWFRHPWLQHSRERGTRNEALVVAFPEGRQCSSRGFAECRASGSAPAGASWPAPLSRERWSHGWWNRARDGVSRERGAGQEANPKRPCEVQASKRRTRSAPRGEQAGGDSKRSSIQVLRNMTYEL